ncbi:MAG: Cof-type HAD-IIB family hydrolase [Sphaerochaetaceae bacterium]|nr:Cof-type HAD-IIB family hydrolase [Sphaerochaetaceae bacterium]
MDIKAIAIDLDGTLLPSSKIITRHTLEVLNRVMDKGIRVFVATGRSLATCQRFIEQIGTTDAVICYNGSCIYDPIEKKDLFHRTMSEEICREIVSLAEKTEASLQAFRHHRVYYRPDAKNADFLEPLTSSIGVVIDDFTSLHPLEFTKAMFIGELEHTEKIRRHLLTTFGENIHMVYSHPTYFEMMSEGATKGAALSKLLQMYDLKADEVMAFGDESNDLEMLALAGHSVAMSNASDQVKKTARYLTGSCDEEGVAEALKRFIL